MKNNTTAPLRAEPMCQPTEDYHIMARVGKTECAVVRGGSSSVHPLETGISFFQAIYDLLRDLEIDIVSPEPRVFLYDAGLFVWNFDLANYCFAKGSLSEEDFRKDIGVCYMGLSEEPGVRIFRCNDGREFHYAIPAENNK